LLIVFGLQGTNIKSDKACCHWGRAICLGDLCADKDLAQEHSSERAINPGLCINKRKKSAKVTLR
jgi:hypothetical protein